MTFTGVIVETPALELGNVSPDQSWVDTESEAPMSVAPPSPAMADVLQELEAMSSRLSRLQQTRALTATANDDQRAQALREKAINVQRQAQAAPSATKIGPEERARCSSEGGGSDQDPVATADVVEVLDELEHMESVLTSEKESKAQIVDMYEEQLREKSEAHARDVAMLEQMLQSAQLERQRLMAKAAKLQPSKKREVKAAKAPSPTSTSSTASLVELDSTVSSTMSQGPIVPSLGKGADLDSTQTSTASSRSEQKVLSGTSSECAETGSTSSDRPHMEQHMLDV